MIYYIFNGHMYEMVDAMDGQVLIRNIETETQQWVDHRVLKMSNVQRLHTDEDALGDTRELLEMPVG